VNRLRTYQRDGLVFDVRDEGPADGDVVVLLHGFPQDASAWDAVVPHLHAAGLRTLAPDQRGYSPGARPAGREAYRLQEMVSDTLVLLDAAGAERAHLVGHDWGGGVVWAATARHPERFTSAVVVSTPHPAAIGYATTHSTQALRSWYMALFQLPVVPELVVPPGLGYALRASGLPADRAEHYMARMREPGAFSAALGWYRALGRGFARALPRVLDPRALLSRTPAAPPPGGHAQWEGPTTYIWGRHDVALGRAAAERTGRFVRGDYRFIEVDAGHWLPETHPTEVADAILERAAGGRRPHADGPAPAR
jgi:pimeloyl-ACP methyl ester carboxylesterase